MRKVSLGSLVALLLVAHPTAFASADLDAGIKALKGNGVPKDASKAFGLISRAAKTGEAKAQYVLGVLYLKGQGAPAARDKAAEWLGRAAAQGHPDAAFVLSKLLLKGAGVPKDPGRARKLLTEASSKGHAKAKTLLASLEAAPDKEGTAGKPKSPDAGRPGPQDATTRPPPKSNPASEVAKVDPGLEAQLADIKDRVKLVTDSLNQEFWDRSVADAEKGVAWEQFCMGVRHEMGLRVEKDLAKARDWYRRAWKSGYPLAETALAKLGP